MGLFDAIFTQKKENQFSHRLHQKISQIIPDSTDQDKLFIACLSGLMARVAFADMNIDDSEKKNIHLSLQKWMELPEEQALQITNLAADEVTELAGLENHKYCDPLANTLDINKRYQVLVTLFSIAAADGKVEYIETEEIRTITHGLLLEHKHFISAQTTVLDYLQALK